MRLQIRNIGAIEQADISIDGITIIAGENNVGKSTIGKTLYAFLHDMSSWQKTYDEICCSKVEKYLYQHSISLEDFCMKESGARRRRTSKAELLQGQYAHDENFIVAIEDYQVSEDEKSRHDIEVYLEAYCKDYISLYIKYDVNGFCDTHCSWINHWISDAMSGILFLELDELELQAQQVKQAFGEIFNYQYRKVATQSSEVKWCDDNDRAVTFLIQEGKEVLSQPIRLSNRIFLIESPKIYDYLSDTRYGYVQKEYLRYLMSPNVFKRGNNYVKIERESYVDVQDKCNEVLKNIVGKMENVMGGRAEFFQKVGLEFKDEYISEPIHAPNVSTGLKSMALLEYALRIGAIEAGDIVILDEPEINLHPEWQVEYARVLVNLQKEFRLKIVITTHSPYFMRAIECFSDMAEVMEQLNVYRMTRERKDNTTQIENVSYAEYGMTDLYDELSAPLDGLEELLEKKYGKAD